MHDSILKDLIRRSLLMEPLSIAVEWDIEAWIQVKKYFPVVYMKRDRMYQEWGASCPFHEDYWKLVKEDTNDGWITFFAFEGEMANRLTVPIKLHMLQCPKCKVYFSGIHSAHDNLFRRFNW